jgi:ADP-ribose pyrophosphatase YjhB (NUDIX family)
MISFETPVGRFNYRVAGVAMAADRVLLHQRDGDDFWTLPGGRPEPMESARDALRREMHEELGMAVTVGRLLWLVENFFTFEGVRHHELLLCFEMACGAQPGGLADVEGAEGARRLLFRWCPLDALEALPVRPAFLAPALRNLPQAPEHLVYED